MSARLRVDTRSYLVDKVHQSARVERHDVRRVEYTEGADPDPVRS